MRIIGMDIHRSFAQVAIVEEGKVVKERRVELVHGPLVAFAETLNRDVVVIEVTGNSAAVERIMRPHVKRVAVTNPRLVRAMAYARVKTDKVDAAILAKLYAAAYCRRFGSPTRIPTAAGDGRRRGRAFWNSLSGSKGG